MKKKNIIIILILIIAIAGSAYYFWSQRYSGVLNNEETKRPMDIMTEAEKNSLNLYHSGIYEVIFRDENNTPTQYRFIGLEEPEEINLELMTNEEKQNFGISTDLKIQVLKRDDAGKIMSYHIIKDDSDIVKKY